MFDALFNHLRATKPFGAVVLLLGTSTALAQEPCDCTAIVGSCNAEVSVLGDRVEIASSRQECSRVDYFIDGLPFVALVVGGEQHAPWMAGGADPAVLVQSCQVCRTTPPVRSAAAANRAEDGTLQPLIQVAPVYPEDARARGVEGHVELELTVEPYGRVTGSRVTAAQPAGIFDQAALGSVVRWRYPADPEREPETVTARIDFRLEPVARAAGERSAGAAVRPRDITGRPRNQCVRENSVYNYGEVIEVGLMSACEEPLLVYGCAPGTGATAGRWVCFDSEQRRSVLVRPSDSRLGGAAEIQTAEGTRTFSYGDTFSVARAPNSQYWWVACHAGDAECNSVARQWARSLNLQPGQIDPQHRTSMPLARSH